MQGDRSLGESAGPALPGILEVIALRWIMTAAEARQLLPGRF